MDEDVGRVLTIFNEVKENTRKLLREMKIDEPTISLYTTTLLELGFPNFEDVPPRQMREFYRKIKEVTIVYFNNKGFTQRAITRELGGSSQRYVNNFLNSL